MSTLRVIENKISYIEKQLSIAQKYQHYSLEELQKDDTVRGAVERELYVIAQACIDLAEALVAFRRLRKPTTLREAFEILGENNILPSEFVGKFRGIAGFRNALAHDYEDLKLEVVYDVLQRKLSEVEEFLRYIKQALNT